MPLGIRAMWMCLLLAAVQFIVPSWQAGLTEEAALREIFIGRCDEFQLVLHPELFPKVKNCSFLWEAFREVALSSDKCLPDPADFKKLVLLADHTIPANKFLFWSGVYDLIEKVKELPEYFPVDKTLMGHTMNSLEWCNRNCNSSTLSQEELDPGELLHDTQTGEDAAMQPGGWVAELFNERQRKESCSNFTLPFWVATSKWFAAKALGQASVILNASVEHPFRETSIFGQYELPLISADRVTFFNIYLVNSLHDSRTSDSCSSNSVLKLQHVLHRKGIQMECTQNPGFLVHILCADDPEAERCKHIGGSAGMLRPASLSMTAAASALSMGAAAALGSLGGNEGLLFV